LCLDSDVISSSRFLLGGHMIQQAPDSIEAIRERLRKMSDLELRQYGRAARDLANPKRNLNGEGGIRSKRMFGRSPKT
jgi:hypothetical protein